MARQPKLPPGMVRRGDTYYANFQYRGERFRNRLSSDLATAKQLLNQLRSDADLGQHGPIHNRYPWADLRGLFLNWAKHHVKHARDYERDLDHFERFGLIVNCDQVSAEYVDRYRTWRLDEGVSVRTVNKEVSTVKSMFTKGVKRFHVLVSNPLLEVVPLRVVEPKKQRRALLAAEVEAIFKHSPPDLLPVFRLFASTGLRRRELVKLTFADVDWDLQTVTVRARHAKNRRERTIPIDDHCAQMLVELREAAADRPAGADQDLVFVNCLGRAIDNNLLRRFYSVCRRAGIPDACPGGAVDLHSLRVTYATLSLEGGANPKAVQSILGHSTLDMTMGIYAKATDQSKRHAVTALPWASGANPAAVLALPDSAAKVTQDHPKSLRAVSAG